MATILLVSLHCAEKTCPNEPDPIFFPVKKRSWIDAAYVVAQLGFRMNVNVGFSIANAMSIHVVFRRWRIKQTCGVLVFLRVKEADLVFSRQLNCVDLHFL